MMRWNILCLLIFFWMSPSFGLKFPLPTDGSNVVGHLQFTVVQLGQDFYSIARHYDVALTRLVTANPGVDPNQPMPHTVVIIPTQYVLPDVPRRGIVVNIAEMQLYYYPQDQKVVYVYPVGIGRFHWRTPLGKWHIEQKIKNPIWIVPESIMKFRKERGDPVPKIVRPGPDDPLGKFAMRLSNPRYLIHSTNEPDGVGLRSSAGCIRMYPENIAELFPKVAIGEPVRIINTPFKVGQIGHQLVLESHALFQEEAVKYPKDQDFITPIIQAYTQKLGLTYWNAKHALNIAQHPTGIPEVIGYFY